MKIIIAGANGMVGRACLDVLRQAHEVVAPGKAEMDITSWDGVIQTLEDTEPDVLLNCAGMSDMDLCESDDAGIRRINIEGPRNLAQGCARFGCKFVHLSTAYVFDGQKTVPQPYFEDDTVKPLSVYASMKVESEAAIRENSPNYAILRTGWLYGATGKNLIRLLVQKALVEKVGSFKVAEDQFGSPTWVTRLAYQIKYLLENEGRGTYHATAEGYCSAADYAKAVVETLGLPLKVPRCPLAEIGLPAPRPLNGVLENRYLKTQEINIMQPWEEDLRLFLETYGEILLRDSTAPTGSLPAKAP